MASLQSGGDAAANGVDADVDGAASPPSAKRPRAGAGAAAITDAEVRAEFAHHDRAVARLNNGTFGCCPASVLAARARWQRLFLSQPDAFYFHHLQPGLARSRAAVAAAVGAGDASEVSLVDNVTTAAAIIMQHVAWSFAEGDFARGDVVLMFLYTYCSIKNSIHAYVARAGATVVERGIRHAAPTLFRLGALRRTAPSRASSRPSRDNGALGQWGHDGGHVAELVQLRGGGGKRVSRHARAKKTPMGRCCFPA
ncbi:hypothetical protein OsI_01480 [Oryza sativa Indica Group]|uniref:Uncharacterized protein n=1 Tax=Oryza sativa subsp. indica TaxID=39946 RepID=B8A6R7_ORYSI|nr:hypothetical protein OsI_01480 [Oryza sativa Indica Group]